MVRQVRQRLGHPEGCRGHGRPYRPGRLDDARDRRSRGAAGARPLSVLVAAGRVRAAVLDMADVVKEAERRHGPLVDLCKRSTYNPVTRKWFGFSDNYVPDPGDYLKTVWTEIGMPDGPTTWEDLVTAGPPNTREDTHNPIPL